MDTKQMLYFTTIIDEGTINAAAKKLHMTQPPLSMQIKLLEEELNTKLIIRGSRKVTLTDAGQIFYNRAKNILELTEDLKKEIVDTKSGTRGTIRIGIVSSINNYVLQKIIIPFAKKYPDINFILTEENTYTLVDMVNSKHLDIAIVRTPFTESKDFQVLELENNNLYAVGNERFFAETTQSSTYTKETSTCSANGMLADYENIDKILASQPLIIYKRWKKILDVYFSEQNIIPNYYCITDDARTCFLWAQNNMGIAIVPQSIISDQVDYSDEMICKKINKPFISSTICAIVNKKKYSSSSVSLLLKDLEKIKNKTNNTKIN